MLVEVLISLLILVVIVVTIFMATDMFSPDARLTRLIKFIIGAVALILALKLLLPLMGAHMRLGELSQAVFQV